MADPKEQDSTEPTSSAEPSTSETEHTGSHALSAEDRTYGTDEVTYEPDGYELGAEADEEPVEPAALDERELSADAGADPKTRDEAGLLDDSDGPTDADDDRELVAVGPPADRRVTAREERRAEKKGMATPKRRPGDQRPARTGPGTFVKESVAELRKVVYPTGQQLLNYFIVVLIFVLFIIAIVSLLDLAFGWAILRVFG